MGERGDLFALTALVFFTTLETSFEKGEAGLVEADFFLELAVLLTEGGIGDGMDTAASLLTGALLAEELEPGLLALDVFAQALELGGESGGGVASLGGGGWLGGRRGGRDC